MAGTGKWTTTGDEIKKYFFSGANVGAGVYHGSLTTPPCSEGLSWVVTTAVGSMSNTQVAAIRALIGGHANVRSLQRLRGRKVSWHDATSD